MAAPGKPRLHVAIIAAFGIGDRQQEALAAVKKGDNFSEVAAKYSESQTAQEGGDMGFYVKGELSKSMEDIVDKLDKIRKQA